VIPTDKGATLELQLPLREGQQGNSGAALGPAVSLVQG